MENLPRVQNNKMNEKTKKKTKTLLEQMNEKC